MIHCDKKYHALFLPTTRHCLDLPVMKHESDTLIALHLSHRRRNYWNQRKAIAGKPLTYCIT